MAHGKRDRIACVLFVTAACALWTAVGLAQGVTGAVIGTVRDADGGVISGATARLESPALIGGPQSVTTNEKGQLRFANLPPGLYTLEIAMAGFTTYRDKHRRGCRRHNRENGPLEPGGLRGIHRRGRNRHADRSPQRWIRHALRCGRHQEDSDTPIEHVRLHPRRSGDLSHVPLERDREHDLCLWFGYQREYLPHRWHELHLFLQRDGAIGARHRFHRRSPRAVGGGVSRVRQRAGGRHQRRHHPREATAFSLALRTMASRRA